MQNIFSPLLYIVFAWSFTVVPLLANSAATDMGPRRQNTSHTATRLNFFEKIALKTAARKINKALKKGAWVAPGDSTRPCGYIVLYPGERVEAELLEISATEVTYRLCDKPNSAPIVRHKSTVLAVVASNGDELFSNLYGIRPNGQRGGTTSGQKIDGLALLSLLFGFIPFTVVGPLIAIVCGIASLNRISRNPDKYTGKGLAITGLILGIVVLMIILFALLAA